MYTRSVFLFGFLTALLTCSDGFAQITPADRSRDVRPDWTFSDNAWWRYGGITHHDDGTGNKLNTAREQSSPPGIVTLHQLAHKVPRAASKEYQRGTKAQEKGKYENAIKHLKKAVAIDPEYSDALNNLGVNFIYTNRAQLAIEQFNRLIAIDSHAPWPYYNLAVAFLMQNKLTDAERAARHGLKVDATDTRGGLILGFSLVLQKKFTLEAEQNLRKAAAHFPKACLLLAPVLAAKGQIEPAKQQLRLYLASGDRSAVNLASDWLQQLDSSTHAKR
jgi:tetratricopeptide (TPR) repeat protein